MRETRIGCVGVALLLLAASGCRGSNCQTAPDPPPTGFVGQLGPGTEAVHEIDIVEALQGEVQLRWNDDATPLALGIRSPSCLTSTAPDCQEFTTARLRSDPGPCVGSCISVVFSPGQTTPLGRWRFVVQNRSATATSPYTLQVAFTRPGCT